MSNLLHRMLITTMAVASVIMSSIAIYFSYEAHQINKETERILAEIERLETLNDQSGGSYRTPSLNEENDVYYYSFVMPPSVAYPFGGYDGTTVSITIPTGGSVWSSFDAMVRFDDFSHRLTDAERKLLVLNLTNALIEQEGRSLDVVQPRDTFVMLVPFADAAPELENQTPSQMCPAFDPCTGDMEPTPAPIEIVPDLGPNNPIPSAEQGAPRAGK